jgi:competence protein ComEC
VSRLFPPVVGLAAAFGVGVALIQLGAPLPPAPLLLSAVVLPIYALLRPGGAAGRPHPVRTRATLLAAVAAGALHGAARESVLMRDCRFAVGDGESVALVGLAESTAVRGRLWVRFEEGLRGGCSGEVRVVLPPTATNPNAPPLAPAPGERLRIFGTWRKLPWASTAPEYAGEVVADSVATASGTGRGARLLQRRAELEARLRRLYPERHGVVSALILARNEGISPELRDAFARAGTAHILSISGFHVGVVAGLLLGLSRAAGIAARPAGLVAAAAVWAYVLFIGAPDAAARAALIVSLFALGALAGRPLSKTGGLATSFLALVVLDPRALSRAGFQLSFTGVLGLVVLAGPLEAQLRRVLPWKWIRSFRGALAAGIGATLLTSPVVAWHFDQVSVVGIPATLLGTPLVAAVIPGAFASLALDVVHPAAAAFLAGGTDLLLWLFLTSTEALAALPIAVAWVPRAWIFAAGGGGLCAVLLLSGAERVRAAVRGWVALAGTLIAVLLLPAAERIAARGSVELIFLDVGQGDAVLIRTPGARWALMDAGPPSGFRSGGAPPVLGELRRRGVRRLEAMLLSHPHLDHIGGAPAIFSEIPVGVVVDPGMPRGSDAFVELLEAAEGRGSGWRAARTGDRYPMDGVELRILNSLERERAGGGGDVVNENSLVVLLTFGAFSALLTGDAPIDVEETVVGSSGPVDVLKVGHHGSRTSSSVAFLRSARPAVAVISVGRENRYGHPHDVVLERLEGGEVDTYRTDRNGTVRVLARRDGTFRVRADRGG